MNDFKKIKSYVGFAIKSGNIIIGGDSVVRRIDKCIVVLIDKSINATTYKNVHKLCDNKKIFLRDVDNGILEDITHITNCRCIAITDNNLANAIISQYK